MPRIIKDNDIFIIFFPFFSNKFIKKKIKKDGIYLLR